jgi:hypothetical protein
VWKDKSKSSCGIKNGYASVGMSLNVVHYANAKHTSYRYILYDHNDWLMYCRTAIYSDAQQIKDIYITLNYPCSLLQSFPV